MYNLRASNLKEERLPLMAVTDADTRMIHWFVSEEYIGESMSGKPFFWTPMPGKFVVRAVDDHGRSAKRDVTMQLVE